MKMLVVPFFLTDKEAFWIDEKGSHVLADLLVRLCDAPCDSFVILCEQKHTNFVGQAVNGSPFTVHEVDDGFSSTSKSIAQYVEQTYAQSIEAIVLVDFRYPTIKSDFIEEAISLGLQANGRPVRSIAEVQDHPCQGRHYVSIEGYGTVFFAPPGRDQIVGTASFTQALIAQNAKEQNGLCHIGPSVISIKLSHEEETPVVSVASRHDHTLMLRAFPFGNQGATGELVEMVVEPDCTIPIDLSPNDGIEGFTYFLIQGADHAIGGVPDYLIPESEDLWSVNFETGALTNLKTGEAITGRQKFPELFDPVDAVMVNPQYQTDDIRPVGLRLPPDAQDRIGDDVDLLLYYLSMEGE